VLKPAHSAYQRTGVTWDNESKYIFTCMNSYTVWNNNQRGAGTSDNDGYGGREPAATAATKLTAKQGTLCQLITLESLDQSEAYRQAYDVSLDTLPQQFGPRLPG
jgi:hypothetical protein